MLKLYDKQLSPLTQNFRESNRTTQNFNELLNTPLLANKQCLFVLDWKKKDLLFAVGVFNMLGYSEDEFNMGLVLNIIHPEDALLVNRVIKASIDLATKSNIDRENTFLNKSFRIKKRDGSYLKVISQSSPYLTCEKGKLLSSITILSDVSFMKTSNTVVWEVFSKELNIVRFKRKIYKKHSGLFSPRELEIIHLIKSDFTSKQIAAKIHLSLHTVVTHRKNIFKKTSCHSVKELITFCQNNGVV